MKLRTPATATKYLVATKDKNFMTTAPSLVDFTHWRIIKNNYPYDNIAKVHDMLIPRRKFSTYGCMTKPERVELDVIINVYLEDYDAVLLNMTKRRSVTDWFHWHLLKFK